MPKLSIKCTITSCLSCILAPHKLQALWRMTVHVIRPAKQTQTPIKIFKPSYNVVPNYSSWTQVTNIHLQGTQKDSIQKLALNQGGRHQLDKNHSTQQCVWTETSSPGLQAFWPRRRLLLHHLKINIWWPCETILLTLLRSQSHVHSLKLMLTRLPYSFRILEPSLTFWGHVCSYWNLYSANSVMSWSTIQSSFVSTLMVVVIDFTWAGPIGSWHIET